MEGKVFEAKNGKMVMIRHFADCPFSSDAYPRTTGRQKLWNLAEDWRSAAEAWRRVVRHIRTLFK